MVQFRFCEIECFSESFCVASSCTLVENHNKLISTAGNTSEHQGITAFEPKPDTADISETIGVHRQHITSVIELYSKITGERNNLSHPVLLHMYYLYAVDAS